MMTCLQITELVTDYVEGNLGLWQRLMFELHVGLCPHCRAYLRQLRETRAALGRLPPVELPPEIEAELLERFKSWTAPEQSGPTGPDASG